MSGTVDATMDAARAGTTIALGPGVAIVLVALIVVGVLARAAWALMRGEAPPAPTSTPAAEGGAAH